MMKKKHKPHHKRGHARARPRNAATGLAPAAPRPRARKVGRGEAPHWKSIVAAVAGGAGSAALGGLIVNQQILSSEAVGLSLMVGGGAAAYFSDGIPRIVGSSVAASGAGQFALAMMNKRAIKGHDDANKDKNTNPTPAAALPPPVTPQLAPPPAVAARQRASGGGVVLDMFRDAANDLDTIEDEWRYGIRDDAYPGAADHNEPIVIDLDEAA